MIPAEYRLPATLTDFQRKMYVHLIDWKRANITSEPGTYRGHVYDALLPESYVGKLPHLHEPVRNLFLEHQKRFPFKTHKFADHMASSQIACANLFLPLMQHPAEAARILSVVKTDIDSIAVDHLDRGFRIEFWDEPDNMLNDHNRSTGTDSDFAIAYRNHDGILCLWLIEHKLTEAEFTTCGGAKSKGRIVGKHACTPTAQIMKCSDLCYYHSACSYNYWPLTLAETEAFPPERLRRFTACPFKGGMNQLWRNQLLAIAIERAKQWPYQEVYFSVVRHPQNQALDASIEAFHELTGATGRFFAFTPEPIVRAAKRADESALHAWAQWYGDLYAVE